MDWFLIKARDFKVIQTQATGHYVAEGLRQTERAPKLLRGKFIKQARSNSGDSSAKAEPQEQRGTSLYTI
jgi:hypothetical protein